MSEHEEQIPTPSTESVRTAYTYLVRPDFAGQAGNAFDRWLADVRRKAVLAYIPTTPVAGETERKALRGVVGGVLCNASNFPEKVAIRILGQDMGPLIERTSDAILTAGFRREPEPREVTTVDAPGLDDEMLEDAHTWGWRAAVLADPEGTGDDYSIQALRHVAVRALSWARGTNDGGYDSDAIYPEGIES